MRDMKNLSEEEKEGFSDALRIFYSNHETE